MDVEEESESEERGGLKRSVHGGADLEVRQRWLGMPDAERMVRALGLGNLRRQESSSDDSDIDAFAYALYPTDNHPLASTRPS